MCLNFKTVCSTCLREFGTPEAIALRLEAIATSNKCLTSSNKKLVETSASLLGASSYYHDWLQEVWSTRGVALCHSNLVAAPSSTARSP